MESPILGKPHSPPRPRQPRRERHAAADGPQLYLAGSVDATAVQQQLATTPGFFTHPGLAYVDLVDAASFDLVGLIVLLAAVSERVSTRGRTKFRLPSSDLARHLLRMWGFPAAASVVAQAPFRTLVERSDLEYFGETRPRLMSPADTSPAHYLMAQKPFGLSAYKITDVHSVLGIMDQEVEHWRSYAVVKLLERLLPGKSIDDIARVVVQELISNILQHPGASIAIIAARLDVQQDQAASRSPSLTIALWDDGASIISALRACLQSEAQDPSFTADSRDIFKVQGGSWSNGRLIYASDWIPDSSAADPEVLLASLYIGISPLRLDQASSSMFADNPTLTEGPEGLLPLYRTVLRHFEGSLEVRSKTSSVELSRQSRPSHYEVKLAANDQLPPITGNLVTVKLPAIDD